MKRRTFLSSSIWLSAGAGLGLTKEANLETTPVMDPAHLPEDGTKLFSGRPYPPEASHPEIRKTAQKERSRDPRPNLLFLLTDQQTLKALSCAGNPWVHTPHLDKLASRGVRFERSWCASPICTPARATLFTGLTPHQTGAIYLNQPMANGITTLGERLSAGGYDCTYTGKWHVPTAWPTSPASIPGYVYLHLPEQIKRRNLGEITDFLTATDAEYYLAYHASLSPRPWHMAVSLHNPHDICYFCVDPPDLHPLGEEQPGLPPLPPNFEIPPDEPEMLAWRRSQTNYAIEMPHTLHWTPARWRSYLYAYYRWVESADRACGVVLKALETGGYADNTLIVFTSDHGEGMAAHRWATKLSLYEESLSVPLIIVPPGGLDHPRVNSTWHCGGIDIVPTFLDYAGLPPDPTLPGLSLRPVVENPGATCPREVLCAEMAVNKHEPSWQARCAADARFKYCAWSAGEQPEQLFDLLADPGETRNLAESPAHSETINHLRDALSAWGNRTDDRFIVPGV